jgi:menaquinone-specific isochorismate synthase
MQHPVIGSFASIEEAAAGLAGALEHHRSDTQESLRLEAVVPDTDPLAWLNHHDHLIRMYCSNRERRLQIAAMGCADMLRYKDEDVTLREALDYVFANVKKLPEGMRYYGGMRFQEANSSGDSTWARFGRVRFVLPAVELIRDEDKTLLAVNIVHSPDIARDLHLLKLQLTQLKTSPTLEAAHLPAPLGRVNLPEQDAWQDMVQAAQAAMASGRMQKVVLARRCAFDFADRLMPMALLQRLYECTPDSFHFSFNYGNEIAFIGASPERLYHRKGNRIRTEALAGTRPRGASEDDDAWLASALKASAKERREHALVVEAIVETLQGFCHDVRKSDEPDILKLSHVQHLHTMIEAELNAPFSDADLLTALHPTPAVGGSPKATALEHISGAEPFDRGWYAGPIGWVMKDEVEFAVAIRCALVEGARLCLFSGAGIMPDSDPEQEWREIESKIGNFVRILTS